MNPSRIDLDFSPREHEVKMKTGGSMTQKIEYAENYKKITLKISDGSIVKGKINILTFGRLSDLLRHSPDKFITIVSSGKDESSPRVFIINKEHVIWAETED